MELPKRILNQKQYAESRGVTPEAVRQAILHGHIPQSCIIPSQGKMVLIDANEADKVWVLQNRITESARRKAAQYKPIVMNTAQPEIPSGEMPALADSRAKKEAYDAELTKLKLEKERGLLIDAEDVKKDAFKAARIVRDSMMNIPDRVSTELAAETDSFKIHSRLTEEIRKALEGLVIE